MDKKILLNLADMLDDIQSMKIVKQIDLLNELSELKSNNISAETKDVLHYVEMIVYHLIPEKDRP